MEISKDNILKDDMGFLFKKLAIPGIIGMFALGLYNFVDAIFIGQFVSKEGLGAITLAYTIVLINQSITTLFGNGAMSVLSRAIGKNDSNKIEKIAGNVLILTFLFSFILTIIVNVYAKNIISFLGGKNEILNLAVDYVKVLSLGFVFASSGPALNFLIRAEGRMKTAMKMVFISIFMNIILDPIFIIGFKMGIKGAAWATVISQIAYFIINILYIQKSSSYAKIKSFNLNFDIILNILNPGISAMALNIVAIIQQIIIFRLLAKYGGDFHIIIMGTCLRVFMFFYTPLWGIGQALASVSGINYGAGNVHRTYFSLKYFNIIGTIISFMCWLIFMLFPEFILSLFINNTEYIVDGAPLFRILLSVFFIYSIEVNYISFFQALGKGLHASILTIGRLVIIFIPSVYILSYFMQSDGIWISLPLADILITITGAILIKILKTKQMKRVTL